MSSVPTCNDIRLEQERLKALSSTSLDTTQISRERRALIRVTRRVTTEEEENRRLVQRQLESRDYERAAARWCDCHARLAKRACTAPEHHVRLTPERCELRICPWCARRQAAAYVDGFVEELERLQKQGAFARGRSTNRPSFKMLTLTLRPSLELRKDVGRIFRCWRALQERVGFARDKRAKLFGALAAVEIGPHRNVHLHVLYWGRFVPQQQLVDVWRELTGDSYVVDIRELRGSWRDAVREVTKYVTKVAEIRNWSGSRDVDPCLPEVLLVDVFEALKGRRRIATYGIFYNVAGADELAPRTCEQCGAALTYIGTFVPEQLHAFELVEYFSRGSPSPPVQEAA